MIDPRFYKLSHPLSVSDIAALVGAQVTRGDPARQIVSIAAAGHAATDQLCFVEDPRREAANLAGAGLVLAPPGSATSIPEGPAVVESRHPRAAFAEAATQLIKLHEIESGQPPIHPSAQIHETVRLMPGVVIGAGVAIGAGSEIGANAVIGPGVQIGQRTVVGPGAILTCALIGDDVRLYPGSVIGEAGFGLAAGSEGAALTPHFGRVILQNGVSIGANSCVDRGLLEDTVIGERTHIDNLCHIGHNCRIGANVAMAAFAGVSGSCDVGDNVLFGGRVGLRDHVTIGAGARIAAGGAVISDVPAGAVWAGYPARPHRTWLRELAWLARAAQKRPTNKE